MLTTEQIANLEKLSQRDDSEIDLTDMPEITSLDGWEVGRFYRPVKKQISIRLDADVIEYFKIKSADGKEKYQSRINRVLREHMNHNLQDCG